MPRPKGSSKTPGSGRKAGTKNKRTEQLDAVLTRVFDNALDKQFETLLATQIRTLTIDPKLLMRLFEYRYGAPPKEHKHSGSLTLEQAVLGTTDDEASE